MRRLCAALLVLALLALVCFGVTETLRNRSGKTASGVTITFSERVRISSYDETVFPNQEPTGRAKAFTFSGGQLMNRGTFDVTWTPSDAVVESCDWLTSPDLSGPLEPTVETTEDALGRESEPSGSSQPLIPAGISEILGGYVFADLPVLQEWNDLSHVTFAELDLATGTWTADDSGHARLDPHDWQISCLKGGVVGAGVIFRVEFSPEGHPSAEAPVEYQISIENAPVAVLLSPGSWTSGLLYLHSASSTVELPGDCYMVDAGSITIAVPHSYLAAQGLEPDMLLGKLVRLAVKYTEATTHYFLEYEVPGQLSRVMSAAEAAAAAKAAEAAAKAAEAAAKAAEAAAKAAEAAAEAAAKAAQPDWTTVNYALLFAEPQPKISELWLDSEQRPVSEGTHWGLPGSDVKGVKLSYSSGGLYIRLEMTTTTVRGSYVYSLHFWPTGGETYGPLTLILDPAKNEAWAGEVYPRAWRDIPGVVHLIEVGDTYFVAYLPNIKIPSREMLEETADWEVVLLVVYVRPDDVWEAYRTVPLARDVAGLPTQLAPLAIPGLEFVGSPFLPRYPGGVGMDYPRTVWDMQVWKGRIYFGHGDSGANAGPIDVWYYAPEQATFTKEFSVDDEQIDHYRLIGDSLAIPGHDAMEPWDFGNLYINEGTGWQKLRTISNAVHVHDVAVYENRLYVVGSGVFAYGASGPSEAGGFIGVSADTGQSWEIEKHLSWWFSDDVPYVHDAADPGVERFVSLFELQGELFASGWGVSRIYKLGPDGFFVHAVDPFPGVASQYSEPPLPAPNFNGMSPEAFQLLLDDPKVGGYIARSVHFSEQLVYIGGTRSETLYRPWRGIGVFAATEMRDGGIRRILDLGAGWEPRDLVVAGEELYVLSVSPAGNRFRSRVDVTRDLSEWSAVADFTADAPAFSVEVLDGYLYVGLGGAHRSSGNIYRTKLSRE